MQIYDNKIQYVIGIYEGTKIKDDNPSYIIQDRFEVCKEDNVWAYETDQNRTAGKKMLDFLHKIDAQTLGGFFIPPLRDRKDGCREQPVYINQRGAEILEERVNNSSWGYINRKGFMYSLALAEYNLSKDYIADIISRAKKSIEAERNDLDKLSGIEAEIKDLAGEIEGIGKDIQKSELKLKSTPQTGNLSNIQKSEINEAKDSINRYNGELKNLNLELTRLNDEYEIKKRSRAFFGDNPISEEAIDNFYNLTENINQRKGKSERIANLIQAHSDDLIPILAGYRKIVSDKRVSPELERYDKFLNEFLTFFKPLI